MNESITPSLICSDLCNLEASVKALEETGCQMLHVDILDGYFSPSMPLGLDTVRQLRKKTSLAFDAHVMAVDNTFFMEELADYQVRIPVQSKLACPDELRSQQPMTSLFEQTLLLYGDAVARVIVERKALDLTSLWQYHANLE